MVCRMTTPPQQPPASPPPGGGAPPPGYSDSEEKTWALIAHFGGAGIILISAVLGWLPPLIAMLVKGNTSPTVRAHAVQALNFHITWAGAMVIALILAVCSFGLLFFVPFLVALVPIIFGIIAGIKANEGTVYNYPVAIKLIK